ncbi:SIR2 family protein [Dysgonomonadaceae bacterium zrk40]|nr:SIR2 family protein [Dysgonomonadaceae bacterium zrk40]
MKDTIEQLIKLVDKNKLSVVVGAGFSKNASPKYLSWKELLKDMILEMYGSRVRNTAEYAKIRGSDNEQLLWNCFVDQIIAEKGYLNIASEYIKRYGYREIIDNYIEARTPLVIKDQDKYFAKLNDEKHEVDLTTHEYLLDVQWNNVYTFNYDNLLDIAGGADRNEELEAEKNNLNSRITQIDSRLRDINKELENIKIAEEPNQLEFKDVFNEKESLVSSSADPEKLESINKQQKSLVEERGKLLEEKGICKRTIESFEKEQNGLYHLVRNSFDLSLQKQRNLIKLHGTIRTPENDTYGFDNDSHCHYIIASHDYEQYKEKHEAFVNLMRIALLQDSFCLIGFSGDDPNFLSWLSWVKDILDRRGAENNEEKIFFIDVSGVPLSEGKKLFFKNHYIKHVPLFNNPNEATTNNIKKELKQLFKKLNREGRAIKAVLQYTKFWRDYKLNPPKNDNGYLYGIKRQLISEVWDNRKFNRLPKIKLDFTGFKQRVIREIVRQADKGKFDEDTSKLFILALYGDFLPLDAHIDNGKLELLRDMFNSNTEIGKEFELLYIRNLNLTAQDLSEYTSNVSSG